MQASFKKHLLKAIRRSVLEAQSNKHLQTIYTKLYAYIGLKWNCFNEPIPKDKETWWDWEEEEFRNWMHDYFKNHKGARNELSVAKDQIKNYTDWFIKSYGWGIRSSKITRDGDTN